MKRIKQLPQSWETKKLGELCDLQNGYAFKSKSYIECSSTLNIRMSNIRPDGEFDPEHNIKYLPDSFADDYQQFLLEEGDLIVAMTDMANNPKILGLPTLVKDLNGRKFLLNQRVGKLHDFSEKINISFLRYLLASPRIKDYYKSRGAGGLQINISKRDILSAEVPVPPIAEQKRIVAILDEAFEGIEGAIANTEKNLANARELFESYLNAIFTQQDEWSEASMEDLCIIGDGNHSSKYPKKSETVTFGVPFIRGTNLVNGEISGHDIIYITPEKHRQLKKGHLKKGDVLFTNRGEIGKVAIVKEVFDGANLNSQIAWFRCKDKLLPEFLFFFLQSDQMRRHFDQTKSGTALQQFTIRMIKAVQVFYPPKSRQKQIIDSLDALAVETQRLEAIYQRKLTALNELKQSILQKAFIGELTADTAHQSQKAAQDVTAA